MKFRQSYLILGLSFCILGGCNGIPNNVDSKAIPQCDLKHGWEDGFGNCHCDPYYKMAPNSYKCILSKKEENVNNENSWIFNKSPSAYINISSTGTIKKNASNNAFYIFGETSSNCSKVTVEAKNIEANVFDLYTLTDYKYGDVNFKYGLREDWNNLGTGTNVYTFKTYCDDEQVISKSITFDYGIPSTQSSYTPTSFSNNSWTSDFDQGYEWAVDNDIDNFYDCQYEFGTGDTEDGCNEYVKENHTGYQTFKGYECTEDCSGHEAGYDWARDNNIDDIYECDGNSTSFNEGCEAYVDENSYSWSNTSDSLETKYNPYESRWESTTSNSELEYNPYENEWQYASEDAELEYNPYENSWEYVSEGSQLEYNPYEGSWEYAPEGSSLEYDPMTDSWGYEL